MMATGLSPSQIRDEMDFPLVESLSRYWQKFPPINEMIACYFEIPQSFERKQSGKDKDGMTLFDAFPGAKKSRV